MASNDINVDANRKGRGRGFDRGRGRGVVRGRHAEVPVGMVTPPPPSNFVSYPVQAPDPTRVAQPQTPVPVAVQAAGSHLMGAPRSAGNGDVGPIAAGVERMRVGEPPRGAPRGRDGDRGDIKRTDADYEPNEGDVSWIAFVFPCTYSFVALGIRLHWWDCSFS